MLSFCVIALAPRRIPSVNWETFWDLLFPPLCVLCKKRGEGSADLCPEHAAELKPFPGAGCLRCGRPFALEMAPRCPACRGAAPAISQARAACAYAGTGRELLLAWKLRGRREAMFPLWRQTLSLLREERERERKAGKRGPWCSIDLVTFVPLHRSKQRERGFNQAEELAREIAFEEGLLFRSTLIRTRPTPPQASGVDAAARRRHVEGAFALHPRAGLLPRVVLLIDDVFTSGATASACARILRRGGARRVLVLTALRGGDGMVSSSPS